MTETAEKSKTVAEVNESGPGPSTKPNRREARKTWNEKNATEVKVRNQIAALPINGIFVVKDEAAVQRGREFLTSLGRNWREIQFMVPNERTIEKLAGNFQGMDIADDVEGHDDVRKLVESRAPRA